MNYNLSDDEFYGVLRENGATNDEGNVIRLNRSLKRIAITRTSWEIESQHSPIVEGYDYPETIGGHPIEDVVPSVHSSEDSDMVQYRYESYSTHEYSGSGGERAWRGYMREYPGDDTRQWNSGYRGYFEPSPLYTEYMEYMETMEVGDLLVLLQNRTDDIQTDVRIYKGWCHHEFISHAGTLHPIYLVSRDDIPLGVGATPKDARYDSYVRREIKHGLGAGVVQDMLRNIRRDQKVNHTQYRVLMDYGMEDCMEVLLSKGLSPYENNIPMEVLMADMFGVGVNVNGVPTRESTGSGKQGTSVVGLRKKKRLLDI